MTHLGRVKKQTTKNCCDKNIKILYKKWYTLLPSVILSLATTKKAKMLALKIRKKVKY